MLATDAIPSEFRQPRAIDLHQPDVLRTVRVHMNDVSTHARLVLRDGAHESYVQMPVCRGVINAVGVRGERECGEHQREGIDGPGHGETAAVRVAAVSPAARSTYLTSCLRTTFTVLPSAVTMNCSAVPLNR